MSPKTTLLPPKLRSYLAARALRQADALYAEGKPEKAVRLYARAGAFHHAARLAIETADERRAVECSLKAALGHVPENYAGASALEAGALLAENGHHGLAMGLFELAGANRQAAELAAGLQRWSRAARLYERAHLYAEAAACYDKAGQRDAALRMLEQQSRQLRRTSRVLSPKETKQLQSIEIHRAEILHRLGRTAEAVELLLTLPPSVAVIDLLEQTGRSKDALEACLKNGDGERAARLLRDHPELDRAVVARAYLGFGRPIEAGNLLASLGQTREAALAYEAGRDWPRAGSRWEAAQEYERAIEAYQRAGRTQDAARCLSAAGRPLEAAAYAAMAGDPTTAASYYLKGGQPMRAAVSLLSAGDRAGAARLLLLLTPGDKDFLEATRAVIPILLEEGLAEEALERARLLPAAERELVREQLYLAARRLESEGQARRAEEIYRGVRALSPGAEASAPTAPLPTPGSAPASAAAPEIAPGYLLAGRYEILGEIGRGGMGRVYKAYDRDLGEEVAIKTLLGPAADEGDAERLLREAQICRKVTHPNIVRVFDLGRYEGGVFLTMELLSGERLDSLVFRNGPLPLPQIREILTQIGAGLAEAHALGIIHRDLKPGNILLTPSRLKILDFGIARMTGVESRLTQAGFAVGSLLYISPEQLHGGEADVRTDLYALGILLYTLLAGSEPFQGETAGAIAMQHLQQPPPDLRRRRPSLPEGWVELVETLLAKRPSERYASVAAMLAVLATLPVEEGAPAEPAGDRGDDTIAG